jgi:hypothetical protein
MSRLNLTEHENSPRWQKIIDHAQATVNLFSNTPYKIKKEFRDPHHYIVFVSLDKRGEVRSLSYNCFSRDEMEKVAYKMSEHFDLDIEED